MLTMSPRVWIAFAIAAAFVGSVAAVGDDAKKPKPYSPELIVAKKFEGDATVEFLVSEVRTVNIDSLFKPNVSHTQILDAKLTGAKDGQQFYAIMNRNVATRLLHLGIEDPAKHLRGKVVRISGTVEQVLMPGGLHFKMRVANLDQVESIRKP